MKKKSKSFCLFLHKIGEFLLAIQLSIGEKKKKNMAHLDYINTLFLK